MRGDHVSISLIPLLTCSYPTSEALLDKRIQPEIELSDSEDEGTGGRRHRKDRKLTHPNPDHEMAMPPVVPAGSEGLIPSNAERGTQEAALANGDTSTGNATPLEAIEPPLSPSASAPGLSMNAFGRPKMTAAVVGANESMDVDDQLPGATTRAAEN